MSAAEFAKLKALELRVSGLEGELKALKEHVKWGEVSDARRADSDKVGDIPAAGPTDGPFDVKKPLGLKKGS
jgi:hypothetical protein